MRSRRILARHAILNTLALAVAAGSAYSQNSPPPPPEVRTSATAERSLAPDLAVVTLRFSAVGRTPAAAGRLVAARADSLRRAFQALGVPRDSVLTASRRGWAWDQASRVEVVVSQQRPINGVYYSDTTFRVHDAMAVRISDVSKVGSIIDSAFAYGVTDIPPVAFVATHSEEARLDAVREATERARAKATAIATANGGRLGRTIMLSADGSAFGSGGEGVIALSNAGYTAVGNSVGGTVVIGPQLRVTATVSGRWELTEGH